MVRIVALFRVALPAYQSQPYPGKKEQWMFNASPSRMTTDLKHYLQSLVLSQPHRDIQSKDVGPWQKIHPNISRSQIQLPPATECFGIVMPKPDSCPNQHRASRLKWLEQTLEDSDEQGITLLFTDPVATEA